MHIFYCFNIVFFTTALISVTSAHGVITSATGDAGGQGTALAGIIPLKPHPMLDYYRSMLTLLVDAATPRDGTRRRPFQQDTTVFEEEDDDNQAEARTGCGMTIQAGEINIPTAMQSVITQNGGLPQVSPGGELTMTLHQVNADGAGPYECMIDQTGTGASFTPMTVTQNVPGREGRDRAGSETDFVSSSSEGFSWRGLLSNGGRDIAACSTDAGEYGMYRNRRCDGRYMYGSVPKPC